MHTRNSSQLTPAFPRVKNRLSRPFSLVTPKAPSTWIERFTLNRIPSSLLMFAFDSARKAAAFFETSIRRFFFDAVHPSFPHDFPLFPIDIQFFDTFFQGVPVCFQGLPGQGSSRSAAGAGSGGRVRL
jgi:hypothetical protein